MSDPTLLPDDLSMARVDHLPVVAAFCHRLDLIGTLYRMVERDLGGQLTNPDGTVRTLDRMRDILFRQGAATLARDGDDLVVRFLSPYRVDPTNMLRDWFGTVARRHCDGIALLGGMRLRFELQPPRGEEYHNTGRKVDLAEMKTAGEDPRNG